MDDKRFIDLIIIYGVELSTNFTYELQKTDKGYYIEDRKI